MVQEQDKLSWSFHWTQGQELVCQDWWLCHHCECLQFHHYHCTQSQRISMILWAPENMRKSESQSETKKRLQCLQWREREREREREETVFVVDMPFFSVSACYFSLLPYKIIIRTCCCCPCNMNKDLTERILFPERIWSSLSDHCDSSIWPWANVILVVVVLLLMLLEKTCCSYLLLNLTFVLSWLFYRDACFIPPFFVFAIL